MRRRIKIGLAGTALGAALCAAYAVGVFFPPAAPAPAPAAATTPRPYDFEAAIETFDFAGAVDVLTRVRLQQAPEDAARFEAVVDTLHRFVLAYVGARLGLSAEEEAAVRAAYAHEAMGAARGYEAFLAAPAPEPIPTGAPVVAQASYNAVNDFVSVLSGHACGLLSFPGRALLEQAQGLVGRRRVAETLGADVSCRDVLGEALVPLATSLRREAVIRDVNTSRLTIAARARTLIAELATAEERLEADFEDTYTARVLFLKSSATVRARARGTVKVGFDLHEGFGVGVDHGRRMVTIDLPPPRILSSEVEVEFTDVDKGLFISVDLDKYNAALSKARTMIRGQVAGSGAYRAARRNAEDILHTLFEPLVSNPAYPYEVRVRFAAARPSPEATVLRVDG